MWSAVAPFLLVAAVLGAGLLLRKLRETEARVDELAGELTRRQLGARRQEVAFAVTRILSDGDTLQAAAVQILEAIGSRLGWSFGALWEVDPIGVLRCAATWCDPAHRVPAFERATRRLVLRPGVGLAGSVWSAGVASWIRDAALEPGRPRAEVAVEDGLHAGCAFPIVRRGTTVAVIELFSPRLVEADVETLQSLTDIGLRVGHFTERKLAEQRLTLLSEASNVLGASLDYATTLASVARLVVPALGDTCVIDIVDENGAIRRLTPVANARPEQSLDAVLEDSPVDVTGSQPLHRVLRSGRSEVLPALSPKLLKAMVADVERREIVTKSGSASGICVPLTARGRVLGAISLASLDPAHRYGPEDVALAEELARRCALAVDNALLFREVQRASEEKSRFLAAVSHDLRTPAHAIMLLSTLIRREAEARGDLGSGFVTRCLRIEHASRAFTELLGDLLDLAYLEIGQKRLIEAPISVNDLVLETTANLASVARSRGLELSCDRLPDDLRVTADPTELGRVLINLIGNALKFTQHGSVKVSASRTFDGGVAIAVTDTGPGIPEDALPFVFDEFFRVRALERDPGKGRGLGLAIAKRIMQAMGGTLQVESALGRGSVFTASLPPERVLTEPPPPPSPDAGERPVESASVLVIDDDAVSAEALAELLRLEGYGVSLAHDGEEGLAFLDRQLVDLVLVDMMMPGMDGVEVIGRIRARFAGALRIVALTGDVTRERTEAAHAAGADAYVNKPFKVESFLETIRLALGATVS